MTVTVELIVWIAAAALGLVAVTTALVWPVAARWEARRELRRRADEERRAQRARRTGWLTPEDRAHEWADEVARRAAVASPTMYLPPVPRLGGYRDDQVARDPALEERTRRPEALWPHHPTCHLAHLGATRVNPCPDCYCPEPLCRSRTGGGLCPTHQHADDIREETQAKRRDDR